MQAHNQEQGCRNRSVQFNSVNVTPSDSKLRILTRHLSSPISAIGEKKVKHSLLRAHQNCSLLPLSSHKIYSHQNLVPNVVKRFFILLNMKFLLPAVLALNHVCSSFAFGGISEQSRGLLEESRNVLLQDVIQSKQDSQVCWEPCVFVHSLSMDTILKRYAALSTACSWY